MGADQDYEAFLREWTNEHICPMGDLLDDRDRQYMVERRATELMQAAKEKGFADSLTKTVSGSSGKRNSGTTDPAVDDFVVTSHHGRPDSSIRDVLPQVRWQVWSPSPAPADLRRDGIVILKALPEGPAPCAHALLAFQRLICPTCA